MKESNNQGKHEDKMGLVQMRDTQNFIKIFNRFSNLLKKSDDQERQKNNTGFDQLRDTLYNIHIREKKQVKDNPPFVFADFELGEDKDMIGVFGLGYDKLIIYNSEKVLHEQPVRLGMGSGDYWFDDIIKKYFEAFEKGTVNTESIIDIIKECSTPGACAMYYDLYRYYQG